jgi:anti-sigma B factor antagonist
MNIDKKKSGKVEAISLEGRMDAYNSKEVYKFVNNVIAEGSIFLVINMAGVNYLSSSGLRVMLSSLKKLNKLGGDLKLSTLQPYVLEVFEIAGFTQLFEIFDNEEEAVSSFK